MSSNRPHESDPLAPHRGRLLGLAYRMLGSRSDAEDVVQDAYLRFFGAGDVHNPEAFLVTVVTRLCLDRLKSAKAQREIYVGPWLPSRCSTRRVFRPTRRRNWRMIFPLRCYWR
jgi:RNA polymerase sigma-70 factor, ECF subfamily